MSANLTLYSVLKAIPQGTGKTITWFMTKNNIQTAFGNNINWHKKGKVHPLLKNMLPSMMYLFLAHATCRQCHTGR